MQSRSTTFAGYLFAAICLMAFGFGAPRPAMAEGDFESQSVILVKSAQPQVVATLPTDITELPKTGLPFAVWGISALSPLAFKLRKNGKSQSEDDDFSPNSIWTKRELDK